MPPTPRFALFSPQWDQSVVEGPQDKVRAIPYFRVSGLLIRNLVGWPTGLEPATFPRATIRCHPLQSVLVRPPLGLLIGVSAILRNACVRCVLACTNPVAVRLQYAEMTARGRRMSHLKFVRELLGHALAITLASCSQSCSK